MKIINNRIYIARGETGTYDVAVIDKNTGAPFMLLTQNEKPAYRYVIEFVVRPSVYDSDEDFVFKTYLIQDDTIHKFETNDVKTYTYPDWDNDYTFVDPIEGEQPKTALFRKRASEEDEWEYRYYDENATGEGTDYKWIPYEFRITIPFPYNEMSIIEPKTYKYEVTVFGGPVKENPELNEIPVTVDFKLPILEPTDFIVGGSLSE